MTGESGKPVSRAEFDAYIDYSVKLGADLSKKVEMILSWKDAIQSKVNRIEAAAKRSDTQNQTHRNEVWDKLTGLKISEDSGRKTSASTTGSGNPTTSKAAQATTLPGRKGSEFRYESIWDINDLPTEQGIVPTRPVVQPARTRACTSTPRVNEGVATSGERTKQGPPAGQGLKSVQQPYGSRQPRTQGVVFFTPRPTRQDDRAFKTGPSGMKRGPNLLSDPREDGRARPSSGQDQAQNSYKQPSSNQPANQRGAAAPRRPDNGEAQQEPIDLTSNNIDMSGMTSSWYDEESSDENDLYIEIVEDDTAKQTTQQHAGDGARSGRSDREGATNNQPQPKNGSYARVAATTNGQATKLGEYGSYGGTNGRNANNMPKKASKPRKLVTRNGWTNPESKNESKKRKRERSGKRGSGVLRAVTTATHREVYIQGLEYATCETPGEFEDLVYYYCKDRGVDAIDTCIIPQGKSRVEAGCKVTVKSEDCDVVCDPDFWPGGSMVRMWEHRPRNNKRENDNDREDV